MFKTDCHLHTTFSPDGRQKPEELLKAAVRAGLSEITVTDHCECNNGGAVPPNEPQWPDLDIPAYTKTFLRLRERSPIPIRIGVEMGQMTQAKEFAKKSLEAFDWDFVLCSLHNIRNEFDFYYIDYKNRDLKKLFTDYFEQLYEAAVYGGFSVMSHLYYPIKYIYRDGFSFDISTFDADIGDIFRVLIQNGQGIEINTGSVEREFGDFVPQFKYAKMFRDLGGEIVTVGSDSHYASRVGGHITDAYEMLREAGFKATETFVKKQPVFHDIEI